MAETVSRGGSRLAVVLPNLVPVPKKNNGKCDRPSTTESSTRLLRRMPSLFQHRRQFVSLCREPCPSPPWMELGHSMRSLSEASTEKRRHSLPLSGSTSLSGSPLLGQRPGHLPPARRQGSTASTILRRPLLPGRHGCPFWGCLEPSACPPQGPGSLPCCGSPDFPWEGPVVPRPHQILGHEGQCQGISIPLDYTSVIRDWQFQTTWSLSRLSWGKCGYYQRFIADYANISAPHVQYTQRDQHEGIPHLHQDAAAAVRAFTLWSRGLMSAPILAYPQFHRVLFILNTDFSADLGAIGCVLSQVQNRKERVIAYGAQRLTPRERSYATTKGELLAVIFFLAMLQILSFAQASFYIPKLGAHLDPILGVSNRDDPSVAGDPRQLQLHHQTPERHSPWQCRLPVQGAHCHPSFAGRREGLSEWWGRVVAAL